MSPLSKKGGQAEDIGRAGRSTPLSAVARYGAELGQRYCLGDVQRLLDGAARLRVLVVGEAIIDQYVTCETLGKAGKEPILAARYLREESFVGGSLAIANHVAAAGSQVAVNTVLGAEESHESFIREHMNPAIELKFHFMPDAPTITKRRFVEEYPSQKLFELYVARHPEAESQTVDAFREALAAALPAFDVVIVADYGHGLIDDASAALICERAPFLAVNVQMNAENRGFSTVSKYSRADFVSASETEVRLEARDRRTPLNDIVASLADRLSCQRVLVTRGGEGCLVLDPEEGFSNVPALTTNVVDRIGAGDAVLAVSALVAAQAAPGSLMGAVAAAVGAQAVRVVGNRSSFDPDEMLADLAAILT